MNMPNAASLPDFNTMTRAELTAWKLALDATLAAGRAAGLPDFEVAILADAEGVSVTFTIPLSPSQPERTDP